MLLLGVSVKLMVHYSYRVCNQAFIQSLLSPVVPRDALTSRARVDRKKGNTEGWRERITGTQRSGKRHVHKGCVRIRDN